MAALFTSKAAARTLAAALLLTVSQLFGCKKDVSQSENIDHVTLRQKVIEQVKNRRLTADQTGKAALPENVKMASDGGYVYISADQGSGVEIIFINSLASSDSPERGFLYTEQTICAPTRTVNVGGCEWRLDRSAGNNFWTVTKL